MHNKSATIALLPPLISRIRKQQPLIHHITNMVVMNDTANITLAIGASPVMAHAREEVEEMVTFAAALVLNIGTLTPEQIDTMLLAGKRANELGIPIILDPVGAGATSLRTNGALHLLQELNITVLRGNASEIGTLVGVAAKTKGVDAVSLSEDPNIVASRAASKFSCITAITGVCDVISDGQRLALVENGHPLLATITGSGCMATSLVATFLAIEPDPWLATTAALVAMGLAGEIAATQASGPGTFRSHLLDAIANLTTEIFEHNQKVTII